MSNLEQKLIVWAEVHGYIDLMALLTDKQTITEYLKDVIQVEEEDLAKTQQLLVEDTKKYSESSVTDWERKMIKTNERKITVAKRYLEVLNTSKGETEKH